MKRKTTLCILAILLSLAVWSQAPVTEKANYLKEDINAFLSKNTRYSKENLMNKVEGDIILSFRITKEGQLDSIQVESAKEPSLAASAITALSQVAGYKWSPAKVNNVPVDKRYKIVFRYRQFVNEEPFDYTDRAKHLIEKEKYDKALKTCDNGIEESQFDAALYELRSQAKMKLGDTPGGQQDHAIALTLDEEVMTVVNVYVIGVTRPVTTTSRTATPQLSR